jgi:hypothetical protein
MKVLLALLGVLLVVGAVVAYFVIDPFADESDPTVNRHLTGTACERLAGLAGQLAETDDNVNSFLLDLGQQAAGIRAGRRGLADLARGGHNRIPGKGFKHPFDDGSRGQVRHFVGYVRAAMLGGSSVTRWIGENLRSDSANSPDGRLGDEGIAFTQELVQGKLELSGVSDWILANLCRPPKPGSA